MLLPIENKTGSDWFMPQTEEGELSPNGEMKEEHFCMELLNKMKVLPADLMEMNHFIAGLSVSDHQAGDKMLSLKKQMHNKLITWTLHKTPLNSNDKYVWSRYTGALSEYGYGLWLEHKNMWMYKPDRLKFIELV
ncbi:hypothetical protein ACJX0J_024883, partial [Zea mays]